MTLEEIIRAGKGKAGSEQSWEVTRTDNGNVGRLFHYSTQMLVWDWYDPANESVLDYSIGWGSVSDQGGMNKAFRILGLPLYYARKGGAEIIHIARYGGHNG